MNQQVPEDIAVAVAELARLGNRLGLTWRIMPGTVAKVLGIVQVAVLLDADDVATIPCQSLVGQLYANQRVMVISVPRGANYVVGYAGGAGSAPGTWQYVAENTSLAVSSTGYAALTPTIGIAFVAPPSGMVRIDYSAVLRGGGATTNICLAAPQVRTGDTVGSGTVVYAAADNDAAQQTGTVDIRSSGFTEVTGLTPGNDYNVEMLSRVNTSTGNINRRKLGVMPS